ncbi:MAG: capsid protein, partial [Candidatus Fimenecus sp.]
YLDLCLQGIMSPATLGIDLGKIASADAQREKKDITGYTRNTITGKLEKVLPKLISSIMMTYDVMMGNATQSYKPKVIFGEYGAPDFDSRVNTVGLAASNSIMSIETQVTELWGSSKDEEWISAEIRRIKNEKGIETVDEPKVGESFDG